MPASKRTSMDKLTDKQRQFCHEYIVDFNATQAAIRAGYSEKTAYSHGQRLLKNVEVSDYINKLKEEKIKNCDISREYVIDIIKKTIERCSQLEPVMVNEGGKWIHKGEYKYDSAAVLKGAELLGRHLAMFTEKREINQNNSFSIEIIEPDED